MIECVPDNGDEGFTQTISIAFVTTVRVVGTATRLILNRQAEGFL